MTGMQESAEFGPDGTTGDPDGSHAARSLGDALRWALELDQSPALAGATFLTREIMPGARDPFDAIVRAASIEQLGDLKNAYKLLRTTGATATERSLAARLYAATIAAAAVRHGVAISRQTPFALARAFEELAADPDMPEEIRELGALGVDAIGRIR